MVPMWWVVGACAVIACMECLALTLMIFCVVLVW